MYGGRIGTQQRSFGRYHPRPFMASPSSRLGVCNLATPGTGKATDFKFGGFIYRANANKSPLKFWRKGSVGVSRDCPNFFGYPLLSQERVKLRISNLAGTFTGPIRIIIGSWESRVYVGCSSRNICGFLTLQNS